MAPRPSHQYVDRCYEQTAVKARATQHPNVASTPLGMSDVRWMSAAGRFAVFHLYIGARKKKLTSSALLASVEQRRNSVEMDASRDASQLSEYTHSPLAT